MAEAADTALTRDRRWCQRRASAPVSTAGMSDDGPDEEHDDEVVRRAIGGDTAARVVIGDRAVAGGSIEVLVMAALLGHGEEHLDTAEATATSRSDRQVVAIARCVLTGDPERVDALATRARSSKRTTDAPCTESTTPRPTGTPHPARHGSHKTH